jgi:phage-related protein
VTHTPSLIKQLGQKIAGIESTLEKASSDLEGADISSDAFSSKGIVLANVYPAALDFGKNDVKTKITQLKNMSDGLIATAATWEQAEQASTVKTQ